MQHAAIYVKESAGYPEGENTQEIQNRRMRKVLPRPRHPDHGPVL